MSRVLLVDDEPQVRDLASRAFAQVGLACDTAADGYEALRHFEAGRYETVVTDLKMPHQHGHSLAIDLLGRPNPPNVVVMTGITDRRLLRDLMRNGVQDVFWKPFDYQSLALRLVALGEMNRHPAAPPPQPAEGAKLARIERSLMDITAMFFHRLSGHFDLDEELSEPPPAVTEFIERFAKLDEAAALRYEAENPGRRRAVRVPCSRPAVVIPVGRQLHPEGEPFMAAIHDISEGGIRLLYTRAIQAEYLALSWQAETLPYANICLVAKVVRCQPRTPFYSIAGEFVLAD